MVRIFLFGSAVVSLLLVTLIYAVVTGQYQAGQPVASPTAGSAGPSASAVASAIASAGVEPSAPASAAPRASGSATAVMVMIAGSSFGSNLAIAAGTTVMFMNGDAIKHTASDGRDGILAAPSLFDLQLEAGASKSYTFTDPGTYQVTCTVHPTMNMTITVQ
jgi:plastocyanin